MMARYLLLLLVITIVPGGNDGQNAVFPKGYIMEVQPSCGNSTSDSPSISVVTDLKAQARAECANGVFYFNNVNKAKLTLQVSFKGKNSSLCEFVKRAGTPVYVVKVIVVFGEKGRMLALKDQEVTVTCTYEAKKTKQSGTHKVHAALIAPPELQKHQGKLSTTSVLTLELTDILGNNITGQSIDLGRKVQLKATTNGGSKEKGLHPVSCDAVGTNTKKRYAILRGGCGDGIVFNKSAGFIVDGLTARSPYFASFHLGDDLEFSFDCNFTLCVKKCDGSSCATDRRRRESNNAQSDNYIQVATAPTVFGPAHVDFADVEGDVDDVVESDNYADRDVQTEE
ncbi:vitelline envelope sperm lysin receptor-like [Haliotis rubra]|uniref:vitelline envelope sperm lysin receptor-like n=1 Tax=Haliotis rubra TaxID=36100 RepID=UPI001EE63011|nr:vitelline envelope sperm lysin receptor-like [Haliotis rubra]XP_046547421.1 vitelline envelope sperm lysin receptor-like [Haliotis rubra]